VEKNPLEKLMVVQLVVPLSRRENYDFKDENSGDFKITNI
jgi:hypothetical protein